MLKNLERNPIEIFNIKTGMKDNMHYIAHDHLYIGFNCDVSNINYLILINYYFHFKQKLYSSLSLICQGKNIQTGNMSNYRM